MKQYCTVSRAYQIADDAMYELLIAHTLADENGWREIHDEPTRDAARWCVSRGMAEYQCLRVRVIEPPTSWSNDDDE